MAWLLLIMMPIAYGAGDYLAGQSSKRISPLAVTAVASTVAAAFALVQAARADSLAISMATLREGAMSGLLLMLANVLFYKALAIGKAGIVGSIVTLSVLFSVVADAYRGTLPDTTSLIGIAVILIGVAVIAQPRSLGTMPKSALLLSFGAAATFGVQYVVLDRASTGNSDMAVVLQYAIATVVTVIIGLFARSTGGLNRSTVGAPVIVGLLFGIGALCLATSMVETNVAVATAILMTEPIVLALLGFLFQRERLTTVQVAALLAVIAGAVATSIG